MWLDATYLKAGRDGRMVSAAVVIAVEVKKSACAILKRQRKAAGITMVPSQGVASLQLQFE